MTAQPIEELVVFYDPTQVAARVARRRRLLRSRIVSLVITVVIVFGFSLWLQFRGQPAGFVVSAVIVLIGLAWVIATLVFYLRAKHELAEIGTGTAIRIGRAGVEVAGLRVGWPEVATLGAVRGGLGRGPRLELVRTTGERASVAFDQVMVLPATLDSTARAYSGGRHGVDLEALDS